MNFLAIVFQFRNEASRLLKRHHTTVSQPGLLMTGARGGTFASTPAPSPHLAATKPVVTTGRASPSSRSSPHGDPELPGRLAARSASPPSLLTPVPPGLSSRLTSPASRPRSAPPRGMPGAVVPARPAPPPRRPPRTTTPMGPRLPAAILCGCARR